MHSTIHVWKSTSMCHTRTQLALLARKAHAPPLAWPRQQSLPVSNPGLSTMVQSLAFAALSLEGPAHPPFPSWKKEPEGRRATGPWAAGHEASGSPAVALQVSPLFFSQTCSGFQPHTTQTVPSASWLRDLQGLRLSRVSATGAPGHVRFSLAKLWPWLQGPDSPPSAALAQPPPRGRRLVTDC